MTILNQINSFLENSVVYKAKQVMGVCLAIVFLVPYWLAGGGLLVGSLLVRQSVRPSHFGFPDFSLRSFGLLTWNFVCEFVMK